VLRERRLIELHVVPRLGAVPLGRLRTEQLEALYAQLLAGGRRDGRRGLDPKSVLEIHVVLRKALGDARRRGLVAHNVAQGAEGFTMATYQHVLPGMQADAARVFAGLIRSTGFNPVEAPLKSEEPVETG
jgi:hypothetical protein